MKLSQEDVDRRWKMLKAWARALELFRMAAEQGHEGAYYNLGVMYENGTGVPQSRTQAVEWYRKAARKDEERAKEALRDLGETW